MRCNVVKRGCDIFMGGYNKETLSGLTHKAELRAWQGYYWLKIKKIWGLSNYLSASNLREIADKLDELNGVSKKK